MHGVGIIGAGSVSRGHLRAVAALESTHLRAVADTDAERLAGVCAIQLRKGIESGRDDLFIGRDGDWEQVEVAENHDTTTRQLGAFVEAIDAGTEPPVTAEYARHLVAVLTACMESSRLGREVVLGA